MPTSEKEINNALYDQLSIVEELEEAAEIDMETVKKVLAKNRRQIERKLYQNPTPEPKNI